jgi:hypothetical protein
MIVKGVEALLCRHRIPASPPKDISDGRSNALRRNED